jgi:hypothetical protein
MQPGEAAAASAMRCHEPHGCPHPQRRTSQLYPPLDKQKQSTAVTAGSRNQAGNLLVTVLISGQPRPSYRSIVNSHLDMLIQYDLKTVGPYES